MKSSHGFVVTRTAETIDLFDDPVSLRMCLSERLNEIFHTSVTLSEMT